MSDEPNSNNRRADEIKDAYYWFNYHLFHDAEFQRQVSELFERLRSKYPNLPGYDADWLRMAGADEADVQKISKLAAQFGTTVEQVSRYASGLYDDGAPIHPPPWMGSVDKEAGWIVMRYGRSITRRQYEHLWPVVAGLKPDLGKDPRSRVKPPENTLLIYCIHKARRAGLTYPQIFGLFEAGALPGYTGSTNQFDRPKLLENYFHRHKFY